MGSFLLKYDSIKPALCLVNQLIFYWRLQYEEDLNILTWAKLNLFSLKKRRRWYSFTDLTICSWSAVGRERVTLTTFLRACQTQGQRIFQTAIPPKNDFSALIFEAFSCSWMQYDVALCITVPAVFGIEVSFIYSIFLQLCNTAYSTWIIYLSDDRFLNATQKML